MEGELVKRGYECPLCGAGQQYGRMLVVNKRMREAVESICNSNFGGRVSLG